MKLTNWAKRCGAAATKRCTVKLRRRHKEPPALRFESLESRELMSANSGDDQGLRDPDDGSSNDDGLQELARYHAAESQAAVTGLGDGLGAFRNHYRGSGWGTDWDILVADLNSDGYQELFRYDPATGRAIVTDFSDDLQTFRNRYKGSGWGTDWDILVTDLNGDGRQELFRYHAATGQAIVTDFSDDLRTFRNHYKGSGWGTHWDILVTDLNGDKHQELFRYHAATGQAIVTDFSDDLRAFRNHYRGSGWGTDWDICVADLNGDKHQELFRYDPASGLAIVTDFSDDLRTFRNRYKGSGWGIDWDILVTDLNGDKHQELFRYNPATGWAIVTDFSDDLRNFRNHYKGPGWGADWDIFVTDLNGDEHQELFRYNPATSRAIVTDFSDDLQTFRNHYKGSGWGIDWNVFVVDLNGDGHQELFRYHAATGQAIVTGSVDTDNVPQTRSNLIHQVPDWNQPSAYVDLYDANGNPINAYDGWCAPTAGGNIMGYWEDVRGLAGLADGSVFTGIAGAYPNTPGTWQQGLWNDGIIEMGWHMDTGNWRTNNGPFPPVVGSTAMNDILPGLLSYAKTGWVDPTGVVKKAYNRSELSGLVTYPRGYTDKSNVALKDMWANYLAEIDAAQPAVVTFDHWVDVTTLDNRITINGHYEAETYFGWDDRLDPHTVVGVGYIDITPEVFMNDGTDEWFVVQDGWQTTGRWVAVPLNGNDNHWLQNDYLEMWPTYSDKPPGPPLTIACDLNTDGVCGVTDIDLLDQGTIAGTNDAALDLNGGGVADRADQDVWRSLAAAENGLSDSYLNGDANLGGIVEPDDLNLLALNWQDSVPTTVAGHAVHDLRAAEGCACVTFDVNRDGAVRDDDAMTIIEQLGKKQSGPCDVNGDGVVSPLDALLVIDYLHERRNDSDPTQPINIDDGNTFDDIARAARHLTSVPMESAQNDGGDGSTLHQSGQETSIQSRGYSDTAEVTSIDAVLASYGTRHVAGRGLDPANRAPQSETTPDTILEEREQLLSDLTQWVHKS
jgi:hypothetical protein